MLRVLWGVVTRDAEARVPTCKSWPPVPLLPATGSLAYRECGRGTKLGTHGVMYLHVCESSSQQCLLGHYSLLVNQQV